MIRNGITLALFALAAFGCAGGTALPTEHPASPAAPKPSATALATLIPSPSPIPTETPSAPLGTEDLLYRETFDDSAAWHLQETNAGAASILNGQLMLSARRRATSILQPAPSGVFGDFYAEVELRPAVCSPGDEFGMAFRQIPSGGHYRVSLLCEGAVRLLRVLPDQTSALTEVTPSGAIIPGAEGTNLLAVTAQGPLLRVYVNRQLVLEDRDLRFAAGGVGLFTRAGTGGQTTVAFDNLSVYALPATPTPAP